MTWLLESGEMWPGLHVRVSVSEVGLNLHHDVSHRHMLGFVEITFMRIDWKSERLSDIN